MSSAGARCDHINHVSTQIPYAVTVAGVSFVCYIISAILQLFLGSITWLISLPLSVAILFGTLIVIKKVTSKKA